MPAQRASLIAHALAILAALAARLPAVWEHFIPAPLLEPDGLTKLTRRKFLAIAERMFCDEAKLRRERFEAAMGMLGRDFVRLPASVFALPRPGPWRAAWRGWCDYARRVHRPER